MTDRTGVDTFVDEAHAFIARHPELDAQQASFGGMAWGMLRAIAECPNCPGVFRVALDKGWEKLSCRNCGCLWTWKAPVEGEKVKKKRVRT